MDLIGENQELEEKLAQLDRRAGRDPNNPEIFFEKGKVEYELQQCNSALDSFNQAVDLNSKKPEYLYYRAKLYKDVGRNTKAKWDLIQALELDPTDLTVIVALLELMTSKEDLQKALDLITNSIEKAKQKKEECAMLYYLRYGLYVQQRDMKNQKVDITQAKKLSDQGKLGRFQSEQEKQTAKSSIDRDFGSFNHFQEIMVSARTAERYMDLNESLVIEGRKNFKQLEKRQGPKKGTVGTSDFSETVLLQLQKIRETGEEAKKMGEENKREIEEKDKQYRIQFKGIQQTLDKFRTKLLELDSLLGKKLDNHKSLITMKKEEPFQHEYVVNLVRFLCSSYQAFNLIATGIVQEININQSKRTLEILGILSSVVMQIPVFGSYAGKLCKLIKEVVDWNDGAKFEETKAKFKKLTNAMMDDEGYDAIVGAVIALVQQPQKKKELRSVINNERKPNQTKWEAFVESSKDLFIHCKHEIEKALFRVEIPKQSRVVLLASKDFALFLQVVFKCKMNDLKPIDQLIREELLDQDYLTQKEMSDLAVGVFLDIKTLDANPLTEKKYLSIVEERLTGKSKPTGEWKILTMEEKDCYQLLNRNSKKLMVENEQIVLKKGQEANKFQWAITKEDTEDGIGWIISPAKARNLCLVYRYEEGTFIWQKTTRIELLDKEAHESKKDRLWSFLK